MGEREWWLDPAYLQGRAQEIADDINATPGWYAGLPVWSDNGQMGVMAWRQDEQGYGVLCRDMSEWQLYKTGKRAWRLEDEEDEREAGGDG
jgi:hypothetical protein